MTPAPRPRRRRLPARVYWFRRVMVLTIAFGLVFGIAHLLGGGASDDTGQAAQQVGAASAPDKGASAPLPSSSASPGRPAGARASAKPTRTKTPLASPSGPCRADDVVVTPGVVGTAYAGSKVTFVLKISTRSTPACTYRVSPGTVAVKLVSGSDRIWSTQDCRDAVPTTDVIARQQLAAEVEVVWHGQRSDGSCSRTTDWAQPGWYHAQAAAFGADPVDVQFELRAPVPVTITPSPTVDASPSGSASGKPSTKPSTKPSGKPSGRPGAKSSGKPSPSPTRD